MTLTVKASLYRDWLSEPVETRRFALDQDVATNYTYLKEKLAQIFPDVQADNLSISYLDSDGDRVTVSSDEELTDALDQFDGTIFRLHIKKRNNEAPSQNPFVPPFFHHPPFWHPRAGGFGFRGQQRAADPQKHETKEEPLDTQKEAESDKPQDTEHADLKGETKEQKGPHHPGVVCDGCNGSIYGRRFKCATCPDYDLCGQCEGKGLHTNHDMYTIDEPRHWGRRQHCGGRPGFGGPFGWPGQFGFGPIGGQFQFWGNPGGCGPGKFQCGPWQSGGCGNGSSCGQYQCKTKETEGNENGMETEQPPSEEPATSTPYTDVLEQLKGMGFEDEGGWLYELVRTKEGDLQKILDALNPGEASPATKQD